MIRGAGRFAQLGMCVLLCAGALAGCVRNVTGPVRTATTYEHKAASTAGAAASSVATVGLAVDAAQREKAFGTYLSVLVSSSEDELTATSGTFQAIQPPDEASLAVRAELVDLLATAGEDVSAVRIVLRGPGTELSELRDRLNEDVARLRAFEENFR